MGFNFNHVINNLKIAKLVLNCVLSLLKYSACGVHYCTEDIILPVCIIECLEMARR